MIAPEAAKATVPISSKISTNPSMRASPVSVLQRIIYQGWRARKHPGDEKIKEIQKELSESKAEIKAQERIILKRNKMIEKGKFIGWVIQHSFRCKNGMGISMLAQSLLVTDKDFKNVLFRIIVATKLDEEEIENARKEIERVLKMNGVDK